MSILGVAAMHHSFVAMLFPPSWSMPVLQTNDSCATHNAGVTGSAKELLVPARLCIAPSASPLCCARKQKRQAQARQVTAYSKELPQDLVDDRQLAEGNIETENTLREEIRNVFTKIIASE